MMIDQHVKTFAQNSKPNTIIGGVGNVISTPALLAQRLGISASRISAFKILSNDVYCKISNSYSIGTSAFYNSSITHYIDEDDLVTSVGANSFRNCINLTQVRMRNLENLGGLNTTNNGAFLGANNLIALESERLKVLGFNGLSGCENLLNLNVSNVTSLGFSCFNGLKKVSFSSFDSLTTITTNQVFYECYSNQILSFPNLQNIGAGALMFYKNENLKIINLPKLISAGTGIGDRGFSGCIELEGIDFPSLELLNCTTTSPNATLGMFRNTPKLKVINAPKLITITGNSFLQEATGLEYVNLHKCRNFCNPNSTYNLEVSGLKLGCTINIHENNLVNNSSGGVNNLLTYAKNQRNAIVNFYDDNGNYVSTL